MMKKLIIFCLLLLGICSCSSSKKTMRYNYDEKLTPIVERTDVMPTFQGKNVNEFRKWVLKRLKFPFDLALSDISGKVVASFVINKEGNLQNIEIIESPHKDYSKAVIDAIKDSPAWEPGKDADGNPANVRYTIPIVFNLK